MELAYTDEQQAFRAEVRSWLAVNVPAEPLQSFDTEEGFKAHRQWEATLNSGRWGMVTWPEALGGRGCDLIEWLIFEEEYYRAQAPLRVNQNGIFLLGPTLMEYGTEEQKARILPPMATGEEVWAQGWSEPNAGSDMAAIRATARLEGDKYVVNGQKIWSTRAVWADWCFGMFRTDPESERHRGLTFILVPLDSPGITVRPIPQLDGLPGFAEIFFMMLKWRLKTGSAMKEPAGVWPWPRQGLSGDSCCVLQRDFRKPRDDWSSCIPPIASPQTAIRR